MKKKILLIEDDLPLLRMYQLAFNKAGLDVSNAVDGNEGLAKAQKELPELILLDLVIPKKDGFEVLKQIRSDPKFNKTKVICLSVLHQQEDINRCQRLGADDYLVKTDVLPDQVVSKMNELLSN